MAQVAKLEITINDEGLIEVTGTGEALRQKVFAYGMLEMAKEVLRGQPKEKGGPLLFKPH